MPVTKAIRTTEPRKRTSKRVWISSYPSIPAIRRSDVRRLLLDWFAANGRDFFWRHPGTKPFAVLLVEMLLTKTRAHLVATVGQQLLSRYPTARSLARARRAALERMLYPLGLHRKRATQLVLCAKALVAEFEESVPSTVPELMTLPYVGRYAANAVACVAFEAQVPVIDANVARIYQRLFSLPPPPDRLATASELWALAERMLPRDQAKAFNWAVLDLGGTICTARAPRCHECPLSRCCDAAPSLTPSVVGSGRTPRGKN